MNVSKTRLALAGIGLVAVVAATTAGTTAYFTDNVSVGANDFTTGSIDITANPATALFTVPAMMPGDKVTAPLTIGNSGTAQLRYAVSATADDDGKGLRTQLVLQIRQNVTTCTDAGFSATGSDAYAATAGGLNAGAIIGSSAQGAQANDRVLAGGGSEVLCFQVSLPLATANGYMGATTTATFAFNSEQTANNA